jgi:hypothetical protein
MFIHFCSLLSLLGFVLQVSSLISAQTTRSPVPSLRPTAKADDAKEAVIIERYVTRAAYGADGSSTRETNAVFRVLAEAGVQSLAVLVFPYNSANETVDVDYVRVRKPDGALVVTPAHNMQDMPADLTSVAPMYSDIHEKHVPVKALGVGDVLEYLVRYRTVKPAVPGQFWFEYSFFKNAICRDEELEVSVPKDKYVKVSSRELQPQVKDDNLRRIYIWKTTNEHEESDALTQKRERPQPSVQITTFRSWEEVGHWYAELQGRQVVVTPEIQAKAAELTRGLTNDDEKIRVLYNFVSTRLHYVSLSFGIGRYQPHAANDVLANGYGDCKDKHTLFAALLKAAGYDAWPALINSSRHIDPDVPSPGQFDHVITVVPRGPALVWLDTTPEVAPFALLLPNLRDRQALVIPTEKLASLIKTPVNPPFASWNFITIEGKLNSSGSLAGHVQHSASGDMEFIYRFAFRQRPQAQWKDLVQQRSWAGLTVKNVTASTPDDLDQPFEFAYDYTRDDYLGRNRHLIPPLPPFGFEIAEDDAKKPTEPVYLGAPGQEVYKARIYLPHEYKPTVPRNSDVKNDFAEYHSMYSLTDGVFTAERRLVIKKAEVPLNAWDEYRKFCKSVVDDENGIYERTGLGNIALILMLLFIPALIAVLALWKRSLHDFFAGPSADTVTQDGKLRYTAWAFARAKGRADWERKLIYEIAGPQPNGIGGWLLLYIIRLWLTVASNLREVTTRPDALYIVLDLTFAALAATAAVLLMSKSANGVKVAKVLLILEGIFFWLFALAAALDNNLLKVGKMTLYFIVAVLWWMYLVRSKRVRNTYFPVIAPPEPVAVPTQIVVTPPPAQQISQAPVSALPVPAPQQSKRTPPPVVAPAKPAKPQPPKEVYYNIVGEPTNPTEDE